MATLSCTHFRDISKTLFIWMPFLVVAMLVVYLTQHTPQRLGDLPQFLARGPKPEVSIYALRHDFLLRMCSKLNLSVSWKPPDVEAMTYYKRAVLQKKYPDLSVDHHNKVILCYLPKVGTTTIKTLLRNVKGHIYNSSWVNGTRNASNPLENPKLFPVNGNGFNHLHQYSEHIQDTLVKEYKTVIVVRHPFERLKSAYYDKFVFHPKSFGEAAAKFVIRRRKNRKALDGGEMPIPTFTEFLEFITVHMKERHWIEMSTQCKPCQVKYDYILRLETAEDDFNYLQNNIYAKKWKNEWNMTIHNKGRYTRTKNPSSPSMDSHSKVLQEYGNVTDHVMSLVTSHYKYDLALFGYKWNRRLLKATCSFGTSSHC